MEIDDLRTIMAIIEQGGIRESAKTLNRVPSGITTRILKLESGLGNKLFLREKKKLVPTSLGLDLYRRAKTIVRLLDEAEAQMRHPHPGGLFRVGAMESALAGRLVIPFAKFHATFNNVNLEIKVGVSTELQKLLLDNLLDVIFVAVVPPCGDDLEMLKICNDKLIVVTSLGHKAVESPKDLWETTLLVLSEGCSYRDRLLQWFAHYNVRPYRVVTMASCQAILGSVAAGMGASIMPMSLMRTFPQKNLIATYPMRCNLDRVQVKMVWKKEMISGNIRALRECVCM